MKDKKNIAIIGAGGFGKNLAQFVLDVNEKAKKWHTISFLDDNLEAGSEVNNFPVLGSIEDLAAERENLEVICGIGSPAVKKQLTRQ